MRFSVARILGLVVCASALFGGVVAGRGPVPREATNHVVKMTANNTFDPKSLDIKVGDTVTFENPDGPSHTATSDDIKTGDPKRTFNTGTVKKGQKACITFNFELTYSYHCEFHSGMDGKINVKPQ
ncbi:hypothetical protein BH10PLA2_BH10PLA2_11720 [soil metagenome]